MSRRRRRRGGSGEALTWALGGLALTVALTVAGVLGYLKFTAPAAVARNADTLCPVKGPSAVTVVLLDATDDLPEPAKIGIRTYLVDLAETLSKDELLELRVLDPQNSAGNLVFSKCNPGDGSDLSDWDANPEKARKLWLAKFREPLDEALDNMPASEAARSPIMRCIQRIALEVFSGRHRAEIDKRLVVVSDMIENDEGYSQYRGDLSFDRFERSAAYKALQTDLEGARVVVQYVQRARPSIDTGAHIEFWSKWFSDNNGRLIEANKLQGAS